MEFGEEPSEVCEFISNFCNKSNGILLRFENINRIFATFQFIILRFSRIFSENIRINGQQFRNRDLLGLAQGAPEAREIISNLLKIKPKLANLWKF